MSWISWLAPSSIEGRYKEKFEKKAERCRTAVSYTELRKVGGYGL